MISLLFLLALCADQSAVSRDATMMAENIPRETKSASEPVVPAPKSLLPDYRIGAGDVLQINVWKEPDASIPAAVVRSDGRISLPLIKEIQVIGMTPAELEGVLTERIGKLIHGADVTVLVREIHSENVYLIGAVRREGPIPLVSSMTVLQAIAQAGGLSDYARRSKIYILRHGNGGQIRLPFDYAAVIKGSRMEQNVVLRPGDTIVVPQ